MKRIVITITLECRDDVSPDVVAWMVANLGEYAGQEFRHDPNAELGDEDDEPLAVVIDVTAVETAPRRGARKQPAAITTADITP